MREREGEREDRDMYVYTHNHCEYDIIYMTEWVYIYIYTHINLISMIMILQVPKAIEGTAATGIRLMIRGTKVPKEHGGKIGLISCQIRGCFLY